MFNIQEKDFPESEQYIHDINNIVWADVSNINLFRTNRFFQEACQLLVNSINLYKLGYFDTAFYSLRQAIELSIGILYLNENENEIKRWIRKEDGFGVGKMRNYLLNNETDFKDVRHKMSSYFDNLLDLRKRIDKYVHKQGFISFYTTYKQLGRKDTVVKLSKKVHADYINMLENSIGAVAIYRLIVDPLPVLLMEDEIALRSPDIMTEPYSEDFVKKYIGIDNLNLYKQTKIYKEYRDDFLSREKQSIEVYNVIHYQYFDTKSLEKIQEQLHLLSLQDKIAYFVFCISNKIASVIVESWYDYFSDVKLDQYETVIGDDIYKDLFIGNDFNCKYKEYYISRLKINEKYTIIKHIATLDSEETYNLMLIANVLTDKIQEEENIFIEMVKRIK